MFLSYFGSIKKSQNKTKYEIPPRVLNHWNVNTPDVVAQMNEAIHTAMCVGLSVVESTNLTVLSSYFK